MLISVPVFLHSKKTGNPTGHVVVRSFQSAFCNPEGQGVKGAVKRCFKARSGMDGSSAKSYVVLSGIMSGMKRFDKSLLNKKIEEKNLQTNSLKTHPYLLTPSSETCLPMV